MFYLFTYGTLMENQLRHGILASEKFIQEYALHGIKLYNFYEESDDGSVQNYPVSLIGNDKDIALGEIYLCHDYLRPYLDQMEQVGTLYGIYSFPLKIKGKKKDVLVYIGKDSTWKKYVGLPFLQPHPTNTIWKPKKND